MRREKQLLRCVVGVAGEFGGRVGGRVGRDGPQLTAPKTCVVRQMPGDTTTVPQWAVRRYAQPQPRSHLNAENGSGGR